VGTQSFAASGYPAPSPADLTVNKPLALADVQSRFAGMPLPPEATPSSMEPAGDDGLLRPAWVWPGAPAVSLGGWWVVPGTPSSVVQYIGAHESPATSVSSNGGKFDGSFLVNSISWPATNSLWGRRLDLLVAQLPNGMTGLRADARALWLTRRPAAERIPPGVHLVTITVTDKKVANYTVTYTVRRVTVTAPTKVGKIVAAIDSLPALQPTEPCHSCGDGVGGDRSPGPGVRYRRFDQVRVTLYARKGTPPVAEAITPTRTKAPTPTFAVGLAILRRPWPLLSDTQYFDFGQQRPRSLVHRLGAILGLEICPECP
jgi:hypothetical protein